MRRLTGTDRSYSGETRLLRRPVLLRGTRKDVAELVGWIWLTVECAGLVRSRVEEPSHLAGRREGRRT